MPNKFFKLKKKLNINHGDQATRQGHIKPPIPWSAGRRNLHTRRTMVRERSRFVKIECKKAKSFIWMF